MKLHLTPATFDKQAFNQACREGYSWTDLDEGILSLKMPEPVSFKMLKKEGRYYVIKWDTGIKEYCTLKDLKDYQKRYKYK